MMYGQAEKEFRKVAGLDPDCAMAYWGIAMTLFHPLRAEPNEDELRRGREAVQKAESLNPPAGREQDYIAAERAGDLDKAKSYYSSAVRIAMGGDSNRPWIKHAKAFTAEN